MAEHRATAQFKRPTGLTVVIGLLAAASLQAVASTSIDPECPGMGIVPAAIEIPPPSLRIEKTDLGSAERLPVASSAPVAEAPAPTLATEVLDELLGKQAENADELVDAGDTQQPELPPSATRLPGVDDEDMPRFRRQMYRTDI